MQFKSKAIKATIFSLLVTASAIAFAGNDKENQGYKQTPTPACAAPTPLNPNGDPKPSAVPEPSAWVSFAIGAGLIVGLTAFNKAKTSKSNG